VRDLVVSLYTSVVAVGVPETKNDGVNFISSSKFDVIKSCSNLYLLEERPQNEDQGEGMLCESMLCVTTKMR